jgi:hypothetical protein
MLRNHPGRDHRADSEKGAVAEGGDDARRHEEPIVRGDGAKDVTDDEYPHQQEQRGLARQRVGQNRQHGPADRDAKRVTGDQKTSGGNADAETRRDFREQARNDEFGGSDGEGRQGQCQERQEWHSKLLRTIAPVDVCETSPREVRGARDAGDAVELAFASGTKGNELCQ